MKAVGEKAPNQLANIANREDLVPVCRFYNLARNNWDKLIAMNEKLAEALERQTHPHIEEFCKERALRTLAEIEKLCGE